ncbi:DNA-directed RNA polymerase III, subunit Rpc31 [Triangularia verruculosa]|uniref:DNA-directed RNA polymerase III subunit n=1 Tax=Triangularia verruculosa TaxID=2587418 RepID=A0AAN6XSQ8_9PEZI|nr:DNA-directed RNA polymerase III, subunit Rpc31 [Triangularia verruculosa]
MFRGGRGGRGRGRGGPMMNRREISQNSVPWATDPKDPIVLDGKPSETYPAWNVPKPPVLTKKEERQLDYFLIFREQSHDSPLYTEPPPRSKDSRRRAYGQEQINSRYADESKATINPFTAVETYSKRFERKKRTLPDFSNLPFAKEFFPPELHATLDGLDEPGADRKRRRTGPKTLALSSITTYGADEFEEEGEQGNGQPDFNKALELMDNLEKMDGDDAFLSGEEDDWGNNEDEDNEDAAADAEAADQYDDESEDDYNAEQYFDNDDNDYGDDGGDDGGDGTF